MSPRPTVAAGGADHHRARRCGHVERSGLAGFAHDLYPSRHRAAETAAWTGDLLGDGYEQHVIELGADPDGEGEIAAVVVRRTPAAGEVADGAVLYVHGFADYFFQTDLADFFAERGWRSTPSTCASPAAPAAPARPRTTPRISRSTTPSSTWPWT